MRCAFVQVGVVLAALGFLTVPPEARGQGLSVDVSAGRVVYDPVSASVGSNNLMGTLRFDRPSGVWVYGTAAAPLRDGDLVWGGSGAGGRLLLQGSSIRRAGVGVDLGAHAFLFRDRIVLETGSGATIDAVPFVTLAFDGPGPGAGSVELRGGWRGQMLSSGTESERRGVFETGVRVAVGSAAVLLQTDARWVRADGGGYPFLGATLSHGSGPVQVWMQVGKWLSVDLDDVAWGVGVGAALGDRATLWAGLRQEAPDPLYWNAARRSWNVGVTRRLGRLAPALVPAPRQEAGGVVIRVSASDAPGADLSIAGDFNNWQPVRMSREGDEWTIHLPLAPGVYHYAFRAESGDWFVPASVAGRRDDGMGGYVALLVVS